MAVVLGTQGYESGIDAFAKNSLNLDFEYINQEFLSFLPKSSAYVLDLGAGVGQNARALAQLGYKVVAVEPLDGFINIARAEHPNHGITWLQDALPTLQHLSDYKGAFEFILLDGVWHHLHPNERAEARSSPDTRQAN